MWRSGVKETGESVFSAVTESVSHSIAYGIVYAAAFIAILLVVWLLLKPLDLAGKLPLVRTVNALGRRFAGPCVGGAAAVCGGVAHAAI